MRKVIAAINMTLDGFCDHTAGIPGEELHQHYSELLDNAGVILYGSLPELHKLVGRPVENLDNAISFFTEIGLKLEGRAMIEGEWAGRVTGLGNQSVEVAMMVTPDGHSRLELSRFLTPATISDHRTAPVNSLGYLRVMFAVDNMDEPVSRLIKHGAERH